ncbi:hypothetical protein S7711_09484 [Stachybotrys chartarum IBT 7711]|uniref:Uncharacterized protein n=1 Tax=Stachybotrys chartarum (strain CBS 109288 / IBT 7711) TaxID=1280523 RepID=A0A084AFL0_STACB|nr:hypothetical protein S7711_09484 [Stachybotrys chartarum IBT 7711]
MDTESAMDINLELVQPFSAADRRVAEGYGGDHFHWSANPDEEWSKISDLAERRRIQNRIAQRSYRKKLKRRLEDLETRVHYLSPQAHLGPVQKLQTFHSFAMSGTNSQLATPPGETFRDQVTPGPHYQLSDDGSHDETGMDSDLLSLSPSDDESEALSPSDADFTKLCPVYQKLVANYRRYSIQLSKSAGGNTIGNGQSGSHSRARDDGHGISGRESSTKQTTSSPTPQGRQRSSSKSTEGQNRPRKRRSSSEADDSDEDGTTRRRPKKRAEETTNRQLACPYWKLDSRSHRSCFSKKLTRIRDVKQHLARRHTPKFYCERCFATFETEGSHEAHITRVSDDLCSRDPTRKLDGITHAQQRQLSRRSDPKLSEEQQWFSIWDVVFPTMERPRSAYLDAGLSEEIAQFREYCNLHGPGIMDEHLAGEVPEDERRIMLSRLIAAGLEHLFAGFSARTQTANQTGGSSSVDPGEGIASPGFSLFGPDLHMDWQDVGPEASAYPDLFPREHESAVPANSESNLQSWEDVPDFDNMPFWFPTSNGGV